MRQCIPTRRYILASKGLLWNIFYLKPKPCQAEASHYQHTFIVEISKLKVLHFAMMLSQDMPFCGSIVISNTLPQTGRKHNQHGSIKNLVGYHK